jgi:rhodanese-related sulfurtransferase
MKQRFKFFSFFLVITTLLLSQSLVNQSFAGDWEVPIVMDGATPITAEELSDLIKQMDNLVIIDSRQSNSHKAIVGSHPLPHTKTSPDALSNLVPDKLTPVVFYCDGLGCPHSMKAIKKAVSYGYVNVFWLRGGISEWTEKGFPTENN